MPVLTEVDPDPVNPRTLYLPIGGVGVFKSTDDGNDWTVMESSRGTGIANLAISPGDASRVYGVGNGLYLSTDSGQSWNLVNPKPGNRFSIAAIAVDPSDPATIFIATSIEGMLKSTDGGKTLLPINNGLATRYMGGVTLQNRDGQTIAYIGTAKGFFKSKDGGATWLPIDGLGSLWGYQFVIFPANPEIMYAVGEITELGIPSPAIKYTTDGGLHWEYTQREGLGSPAMIAVDPTNPSVLYMAGGDENAIVTRDGGATWGPIAGGLNSDVNFIAISPTNPEVFYAATYYGFYLSTDGATTWSLNDTGLPGSGLSALAIDPTDPQVEYGVGAGFPNLLFKSTDAGQSWSQLQNGLQTDQDTVSTISSIAIDPSTPTRLFVATDLGIFQSTNSGATWTNVTESTVGSLFINSISIDPANGAIIYAASESGLLKSIDGGATWSLYAAGLPKHNPELFCVAIDPSNETTLYAGGFNLGVFKSTDGGRTWSVINSNRSNFDVITSLLVDPSNPQVIYAGTLGRGLLRSTTGGNHWRAVPGEQPDKYVNDLKIDAAGTIYAATGNGLAVSRDGINWSNVSQRLHGDWTYQVILGDSPASAMLGAASGIVKVNGISVP